MYWRLFAGSWELEIFAYVTYVEIYMGDVILVGQILARKFLKS